MITLSIEGLARCAHCGGHPRAYKLAYHETPRGCGELFEIECSGCGIRTGKRHTLIAAVIIWNRRGRRLRGGSKGSGSALKSPAGGRE